MRWRRGALLILIALVCSMALNAVLLADRLFSSRRSPGPAQLTKDAASAPVRADSVCRAKLRRCQREGLEILTGAFEPSGADSRSAALARAGSNSTSSTPGGEAEAGASAALVSTDADPELQRSVLCDVAKRHLHRLWGNRREQIVGQISRGLSNAEKRRSDTERDLERFAGMLGLSETQTSALQREYGPLRSERIQELHAALTAEPPELAAALQQARTLFAGEDQLVERLFGSEAKSQLRLSELERRTVILALLAALADRPWDDGIGW